MTTSSLANSEPSKNSNSVSEDSKQEDSSNEPKLPKIKEETEETDEQLSVCLTEISEEKEKSRLGALSRRTESDVTNMLITLGTMKSRQINKKATSEDLDSVIVDLPNKEIEINEELVSEPPSPKERKSSNVSNQLKVN